MIWQTPSKTPASAQTVLAARILETVPRHCAYATMASQFRVAEAASGVAAYLTDPAGTTNAPVDTARLCALLSDALEANGDRLLACRIRSFGDAVVYAGQWHAAPGQPVWILNVGRLIGPGESGMEILLFERLRLTLESFGDVWDSTQGRGILGLRDLRGAVRRLVGGRVRGSRIATMADTIQRFCSDRLEVMRTRRSWQGTPRVMCLHS